MLKSFICLLIGSLLFCSQAASGQCPTPANTPPGSLDGCFALTGAGLNNEVLALALQPDGKIIVGGAFTSYNGTPRKYICRLNANGTLDASFAPTGTGLSNQVNALALQPDGKILVGGKFNSYDGHFENYICRLNANGTLDRSFSPRGGGLNDIVNTIVLQPDGKVLVGGHFNTYNGTTRNRICRLKPNGILDSSFSQTGTGLVSDAFTLALQPNGKVLVGGDFYSYNGGNPYYLCRVNTDGTLDTHFTPTGYGLNDYVHNFAIQPDGKILVVGDFTLYDLTARTFVLRLNPDETLDTTFKQTGSGLNNPVMSLALQPDGKIIVGGWFAFYNDSTRSKICRLNADGSLDFSFAQNGLWMNSKVNALVLQPDGNVLVGGNFYTFNGGSISYLVRLHAYDTPVVTKPLATAEITVSPNPAHDFITVQSTQLIRQVWVYDALGRVVASQQTGLLGETDCHISVSGLLAGIYRVVALAGTGVSSTSLVIE